MYTGNKCGSYRGIALNNRSQRERNEQVLSHAPTPSFPPLPFDITEVRNSIMYRLPSLVMGHFRAVLLGAIAAYVFFYVMVGSGKFYVRLFEMVVVLALCSQVARLVRLAIQFNIKHINQCMHYTSHRRRKEVEGNKLDNTDNFTGSSHKVNARKGSLSLPSSPTLN